VNGLVFSANGEKGGVVAGHSTEALKHPPLPNPLGRGVACTHYTSGKQKNQQELPTGRGPGLNYHTQVLLGKRVLCRVWLGVL
jgi:hypothetical protein